MVEQDRTFQAFFSLLAGDGLEVTPRYLAESPPVGRMDELVDRLFFWKGGRWVKGRQLEGLSKWLEQFMDLVNQTLLVTGVSEEMKVFVEVMNNYQQAVRQANQYKLALRISW